MKKNFKMLAATMMAAVMTIAMTACGTEPSTSREDTTTVTTTESSVKEETVTQEPVVEEPVAQETETEEPSTETPALTGPVDITIATVGGMDFNDNVTAACLSVGYDYLFEDIKYYLEESDIAIGVMQTPVIDGEQYGIADAIYNAGFDAFNVATVNCYDEGVEGLNRAMGALATDEVLTFGAQTNANHFDKIAYVDAQGIKVAFISGTQGVNASEDTVDVNSVDEDVLISQIEEAKSNGAVVIVVSLNFSDDVDSTVQRELAMKLGNAGAHIVLASGNQKADIDIDTLVDEEGNPVCKFVGAQGSFVTNTQRLTMITRVKVTVNEDGTVDFYNGNRIDYLPIRIDDEDHYKLIPITADDLENGDWSEAEKEFIEWTLR